MFHKVAMAGLDCNELSGAPLGSASKQVLHSCPHSAFSNITCHSSPLRVLGKFLICGHAPVFQQLDHSSELSIKGFKIREDFLENLLCGVDVHVNLLDQRSHVNSDFASLGIGSDTCCHLVRNGRRVPKLTLHRCARYT